jgi:CDP-paratose 2-epimerase
MRTLLVTGSAGLIGSEVVTALYPDFDLVYGIDNNHRKIFFGREGDTGWRRQDLERTISSYRHQDLDIRNREAVLAFIERIRPTHIVHCAAQPSHDLAARLPFDDFDVNAVGTLNILEAARRNCPEAIIAHLSTNKVYGDGPNRIRLREEATRWEVDDPAYARGIPESFSIDQSLHSLFGASKVAGDILVQEYGRYFGMRTCCLRGGCLTGPNHSGVELHGFLSYLVKANIEGRKYIVFGYKGKQVRDNIHACDVAEFIRRFFAAPRVAEVYNIGGGFENSVSILEAFDKVAVLTGRKMIWEYTDQARVGDHICYYSDLSKMKEHYPGWKITRSLDHTLAEIVDRWKSHATTSR